MKSLYIRSTVFDGERFVMLFEVGDIPQSLYMDKTFPEEEIEDLVSCCFLLCFILFFFIFNGLLLVFVFSFALFFLIFNGLVWFVALFFLIFNCLVVVFSFVNFVFLHF